MLERVFRIMLFGAYQVSIALGILLLPVAVVAGRLGIPLPVHRLLAALGSACDPNEDAA